MGILRLVMLLVFAVAVAVVAEATVLGTIGDLREWWKQRRLRKGQQ